MCVVLHGLHHRHVRPWELFQLPPTPPSEEEEDPLSPTGTHSNDIGTRFWKEKYRKRNLIRKVFDREVWVQEPALRQIQDAIFLQALVVATVAGVAVTAVFVWGVPRGKGL